MGLFSWLKQEEEKALHIIEDAARRVGQKALRSASLAYSDAKAAMHQHAEDVEKAKARLEDAMAKAAAHADKMKQLAAEAAEHAKAEAERLAAEAEHAAQEAAHRAEHVLQVTVAKVEEKIEPKVEPKLDVPVTPSAESTYKI